MHVSGIRLAKHAGSWYPAQSNYDNLSLDGILQK